MLNSSQAFRQAIRPSAATWQQPGPTPLAMRLLSDATRQAIEKAVASSPVVLFMKGTPETPQCGFSRASIEILGLQGVDPKKFAAFNVLENSELRQGTSRIHNFDWIDGLMRYRH
jgi:monothiol glutaredoxin